MIAAGLQGLSRQPQVFGPLQRQLNVGGIRARSIADYQSGDSASSPPEPSANVQPVDRRLEPDETVEASASFEIDEQFLPGYSAQAAAQDVDENRLVGHEAAKHDVDDASDHDGRRKRQRRAPVEKPAGQTKKFACPYFKRNRKKYSKWTSCPGPGWDEVHRVK
jgi:hypothetical protein